MTVRVNSDSGVLFEMGQEVKACNVEKGWYDVNPLVERFMESIRKMPLPHANVEAIEQEATFIFGPRTFGDDVALLHSEVSEMLEAFRDHGLSDATSAPEAKPEGVGSEAADVLVRLLDTCDRYNINLFEEWRRKVDFNWTRPVRHGKKAM